MGKGINPLPILPKLRSFRTPTGEGESDFLGDGAGQGKGHLQFAFLGQQLDALGQAMTLEESRHDTPMRTIVNPWPPTLPFSLTTTLRLANLNRLPLRLNSRRV